jgi:hypothetical protein
VSAPIQTPLGDRALGEAGAARPPPFQVHGNGMCTQHHVSGILPKQHHVITLLISMRSQNRMEIPIMISSSVLGAVDNSNAVCPYPDE